MSRSWPFSSEGDRSRPLRYARVPCYASGGRPLAGRNFGRISPASPEKLSNSGVFARRTDLPGKSSILAPSRGRGAPGRAAPEYARGLPRTPVQFWHHPHRTRTGGPRSATEAFPKLDKRWADCQGPSRCQSAQRGALDEAKSGAKR